MKQVLDTINSLITSLYTTSGAFEIRTPLQTDTFASPYAQFAAWFTQEVTAGNTQAYSVALATATQNGIPSVRMVLLKRVEEKGFVFFSNYESRKGKELSENPHASLLFYWPQTGRQVRVEGAVTKLTAKASDTYFATRSRESQINTWVSKQSAIVGSYNELIATQKKLVEDYNNKPIPRPSYWGGYVVMPTIFEFWQQGEHRLHARTVYTRQENTWVATFLSP